MVRTSKLNTNQKRAQDNLQAMELMTRVMMANMLGVQYDGKRDLYDALGYPKTITFDQYWAQYSRQDIAGAVINRPVQDTWKGDFSVSNPDDKQEQLRKQFKQLYKDLKLKDKFIRLDKLSSLGEYGVLLLGFNDVTPDLLIKRGRTEQKVIGYSDPVNKSAALKLIYTAPYAQNAVIISEWEKDNTSPRYGLPKTYDIMTSNQDGTNGATIKVHYSRVLHVTGERLNSEVYGIPTLQRIFNRLMDIEKLVGGSAEMFWRGARPGYAGEVDKEFTMSAEAKENIQTQIEEYEHNLRRILINKGVKLESLQQQIADPANHLDIQIQMISSMTGIPKRILMGSELGELASSQDRSSWINYVNTRRQELAQPQIIEPFIDMMMEYGILQEQEYEVDWQELAGMTDAERAALMQTRVTTLKTYADSMNATNIIPEKIFLRTMLGLNDNEIAEIETELAAAMKQQEKEQATQEEENIIEEEENVKQEKQQQPNTKQIKKPEEEE